jgi:hypothetical protein
VEHTYEPRYKNRISGIRRRASWQMTTKPRSIKGAGGTFGGCVRKAVERTSGDLPCVSESRLRSERSVLPGRQKSAAGIVVAKAAKARTVPARG